MIYEHPNKILDHKKQSTIGSDPKQPLTFLTKFSLVARRTFTSEIIISILAQCLVLTRIRNTVVDVNFTIVSCESSGAGTSMREHSVLTNSFILTWIRIAVIDICNSEVVRG